MDYDEKGPRTRFQYRRSAIFDCTTERLLVCSVTSREVIAALKADGWTLDRVTGSPHIFRHPTKPGTVAVPHPRKDIPLGTLKAIERQTRMNLRR